MRQIGWRRASWWGETTDTPFFGQDVHNPRQLVAYLGLTPSEHSSGNSERRGGITEAGSGLARHALIAGARSERMQARVSAKRRAGLEALPNSARDIAWNGQLGMRPGYRRPVAAGTAKGVVITAIAREMMGFMRSEGDRLCGPAPSKTAR